MNATDRPTGGNQGNDRRSGNYPGRFKSSRRDGSGIDRQARSSIRSLEHPRSRSTIIRENSQSLVLGTRGSRLARAQTEHVVTLLKRSHPDLNIEIRVIRTEGDIDRTSPLASFGGRGAFVRSIENALLEGNIDAGVHSLKDLPSRLPDGLMLGSVPGREDPRDVLVASSGRSFGSLPAGSVVATGSDRRRIQAAALRPDLVFAPMRGNIETRIGKVGGEGIDGVMLAAAGLKRLGLGGLVTQTFEPDDILPAPCQGALGLECREGDSRVIELVGAIENSCARLCADCERAFIETLGLGCHAPVAALAVSTVDEIRLDTFAADMRGLTVRRSMTAPFARAVENARKLAAAVKDELSLSEV